MAVLIAAGVLLLALLVWWIATYNRFVRLRHAIAESWADVDVELKRRYELIPNLVATVKGYAAHEREVFERVTQLRDRAVHGAEGAAGTNHGRDENALRLGLKQLFAVAERYPELRADAHFRALQDELAVTEDRIAAARRFYNGNVRDLRNLAESFPTSLVGGATPRPAFFEIEDANERVVPRV